LILELAPLLVSYQTRPEFKDVVGEFVGGVNPYPIDDISFNPWRLTTLERVSTLFPFTGTEKEFFLARTNRASTYDWSLD
jgi:hypothetical protein